MAKRFYFMSTKCARDDGSGSYSFSWANANYTSRKADPMKVFNIMLDDSKEGYKEKGLNPENIEIISFNKV